MVPFEVVLIPNYVTVARLGWLDTWAGIIIPTAGVAFGAFLLKQTFRSIPKEIAEASDLAGVTRFGFVPIVGEPTLDAERGRVNHDAGRVRPDGRTFQTSTTSPRSQALIGTCGGGVADRW